MVKRLSILLLLVMSAAINVVQAQDATLVLNVPNVVEKGVSFRVSYVVNTSKASNFRAPSFDDFEVLSGPGTSTSSSTSIINGKRTTTSSITYTYLIVAHQEGEFTIPPATVVVDNKTITSNKSTIKVLPGSGNQGGGTQQRSSEGGSAGQTISSDNLFILATINKSGIYEQESMLLTYKVYVNPSVNLSNLSNSMPDLKNFHVQEVELPRQKEFQVEEYKGRRYKTLLWSQYILFPQRAGRLEIPATSFDAVITQAIPSNDMFDMFFNANRYVNINREIVSNRIDIDVKPLPSGKSSAFYGAVGNFSITSEINTTELKANEPITIKVILSGSGNMKLTKTPLLKFPNDFDIYDPKVEHKYALKGTTQSGNKVYEYLAIPRYAGVYTIPSLEYQYFDPSTGRYETISTQSYTINVERGDNQTSSSTSDLSGYVSKEELRFVGQDVRFKKTSSRLISLNTLFFGSYRFYILLLLPILVLVIVLFAERKRLADSSNVTQTKRKRANSVATKRLKRAKRLIIENNKELFYDEILKALWGYYSDKFSIPVASLSKETIIQTLKSRGVDDKVISKTIVLLDECEFARYAPGDDNIRMDKIYDSAATIIGQMENLIK